MVVCVCAVHALPKEDGAYKHCIIIKHLVTAVRQSEIRTHHMLAYIS